MLFTIVYYITMYLYIFNQLNTYSETKICKVSRNYDYSIGKVVMINYLFVCTSVRCGI